MNERIKELKKQAWEYAMAVHDGHIVPPLDKEVWPLDEVFEEKFAELIVKEAGAYLMQPEFIGRSDLDWSMVLNEHFGVEEK